MDEIVNWDFVFIVNEKSQEDDEIFSLFNMKRKHKSMIRLFFL
jgi:hypothetical protein